MGKKNKKNKAIEKCGGKLALKAAQRWAKEQGRKAPEKIKDSSDFRAIVANCEAHQQQKENKPRKQTGPKGPSKKADVKDVLNSQKYAGYVDGEGMTPAEFDLYRDTQIQTLIGDQQTLLQGLRNEAQDLINQTSTKNIQISEDAATARQQYASDAEKEWRKYLGDISYDTAIDKAKVEGQYALDLQDIINAGNESVENIRGGYLKDVETIRGGYAESVENIRGGYQKDIAKTNRDAAIFGNFVAGFWN
jgi:hypothetical protein